MVPDRAGAAPPPPRGPLAARLPRGGKAADGRCSASCSPSPPSVYYDTYEKAPRTWGLTALEDQNVGGLVMMVEQSLVLVIAFVGLLRAHDRALRAGRAAPARGDGGLGNEHALASGRPVLSPGVSMSPSAPPSKTRTGSWLSISIRAARFLDHARHHRVGASWPRLQSAPAGGVPGRGAGDVEREREIHARWRHPARCRGR